MEDTLEASRFRHLGLCGYPTSRGVNPRSIPARHRRAPDYKEAIINDECTHEHCLHASAQTAALSNQRERAAGSFSLHPSPEAGVSCLAERDVKADGGDGCREEVSSAQVTRARLTWLFRHKILFSRPRPGNSSGSSPVGGSSGSHASSTSSPITRIASAIIRPAIAPDAHSKTSNSKATSSLTGPMAPRRNSASSTSSSCENHLPPESTQRQESRRERHPDSSFWPLRLSHLSRCEMLGSQ